MLKREGKGSIKFEQLVVVFGIVNCCNTLKPLSKKIALIDDFYI